MPQRLGITCLASKYQGVSISRPAKQVMRWLAYFLILLIVLYLLYQVHPNHFLLLIYHVIMIK